MISPHSHRQGWEGGIHFVQRRGSRLPHQAEGVAPDHSTRDGIWRADGGWQGIRHRGGESTHVDLSIGRCNPGLDRERYLAWIGIHSRGKRAREWFDTGSLLPENIGLGFGSIYLSG
jgi:hypothetical protein